MPLVPMVKSSLSERVSSSSVAVIRTSSDLALARISSLLSEYQVEQPGNGPCTKSPAFCLTVSRTFRASLIQSTITSSSQATLVIVVKSALHKKWPVSLFLQLFVVDGCSLAYIIGGTC